MPNPQVPEFVVTRTFAAPRDLVFKTWSTVEHLAQWLAPPGCTVTYLISDIKPQGTAHYCMALPDGSKMYGAVQYRVVEAPERLVYVQSFADEQARPVRHPMSATWPLEMLTTIRFRTVEAQTELTLTWQPLNATPPELETFRAGMAGMRQGWDGTFKMLDAYLSRLNQAT